MDIDVHKIARLARIRLTDEEAKTLGPQLVSIIGYVESLQVVDTEHVPTTAHPHDIFMPLRDDTVSNTDNRDALQASAPAIDSGLYTVPKVIE